MTQHLSLNRAGLIKYVPALIQGFIFYLFPLPQSCWYTKDSPASLQPASGTGCLLCNGYYSSPVAIEADMMRQSHR